MKITDMSLDNRPRERLEKHGAGVLSSAELLALVLKSGTKKENIIEICNKLISKYGLEKLSNCSLQELSGEHGIGKAKASQIIAIFELYKRIETIHKEKNKITCSQDVADLFTPKLAGLKKEHFVAVYLDTRNKIIKEETITIGTINSSIIHPREIFHGAIKSLANSIIVIHNHPSGNPEPSEEDLEITKIIEETGKIIGIKLLDHLIVAKNGWWSWRDSLK